MGLKAPRGGSTPGARLPSWVVPTLVLALVGGFGGGLAVGLLVAGAGDSGQAATTTTRPATATTVPWDPAEAYGATVAVDGSPLPMLGSAETDTAIGRPLPVITGTDFAGRRLTIATDGRPKLIVALAHWCPYCNAEVPILQEWYGDGPEGIDLITLSVYTDPNRSNFPPAAWLAEARWDMPLLADDSQRTLVTTLGIPAVPFWLLVSADGTVLQRLTGQLPAESLDGIAEMLRGTATS
ncbi:MAG: TlpA family protein disulfide reductase [Acidimicrobiia bacterium]|nr:TlpA family protein disulfide reductase [Acidimicrobiia bacterium]